MTDIVTLEEAKLFIKVDDNLEDATIAIMVGAATEAVLETADAWDQEGDPPNRLKLAVLSRVAIAFDNRNTVEAATGEPALLSPLRSLSI